MNSERAMALRASPALVAVGGANILEYYSCSTPCELSTRVLDVRKFSRILQPTATLVQDSGTSAERAPLFDKAVFRKATCTPVGSHFQKLRHAQVLFFCTGAVFLYCFSRTCETFTDSCNAHNSRHWPTTAAKNTCMLRQVQSTVHVQLL